MSLDIKNITIIDSKTGIDAPSDLKITVDGLYAQNVETLFKIRPSSSLLHQLGLPSNFSQKDWIKMIEIKNSKEPSESKLKKLGALLEAVGVNVASEALKKLLIGN